MLRPYVIRSDYEPSPIQRLTDLFRAIRERDSDTRRVDDFTEPAAAGDTHRFEQTTSGIRRKRENHAVRVMRRAAGDRHVPSRPLVNEAGHALRDAQDTGEPLRQRRDRLAHPVRKTAKS